ncbi:MAG: hypothetical protein U0237_16310 [Thermoleophilia bacterium]
MSSITAIASRNAPSVRGTRRLMSDSTPTAKAMSVAMGIPTRRAVPAGVERRVDQRRHRHPPEGREERHPRDAAVGELADRELPLDLEARRRRTRP